MPPRTLTLLLAVALPHACDWIGVETGPVAVPAQPQPLENEALRHLRAIKTAEMSYFGERMTYSAVARQIGFEPDKWCADGARLKVTAPADPRQALGCHFLYELSVNDKGWSASAHGFGPAAGLELSIDPQSPRAAPAAATEAALGASTPTTAGSSQRALVAEALDDLHFLYEGERSFFGMKNEYTANPAYLARSQPSCPGGDVAATDPGAAQIAGCDFVYSVHAAAGAPLQQVTLWAHGVGRAVGVDIAVEVGGGGDREGIPFVPSR